MHHAGTDGLVYSQSCMRGIGGAPSHVTHTVGPSTPFHPILIIALIASCCFSTAEFRVRGDRFFQDVHKSAENRPR